MSTYSICMILNHGVVLETFPIESRFVFPNNEDLIFLKGLLEIRMPEDLKYRINKYLKFYRINNTSLYYNNKNYGLYSLMDFTNDILTKHKANNIYVLNMSYEELYLKTFEYIRGYRSKRLRPFVFSSLTPGGICPIENGAISDVISMRTINIPKAKKIDSKEDLPKSWYKVFHRDRIMEGYSRNTSIYSEIRGPVL